MQDVVIGEECSQQRHSLEVTYPISNGIVQQWNDMQHIWDHTFYKQLQVDPKECKILLTDPPLNPKGNRDRLLQTMFEQYGFAAAFIQIQAVLTLYAQGDDVVYIHSFRQILQHGCGSWDANMSIHVACSYTRFMQDS